jgi:membrane fusion protein, copper/silver efflux system
MNSIASFLKSRGLPLVLVAAGLVAGYWLARALSGGEEPAHTQHQAPATAERAASAGQEQMYTCSMHPQVRSPTPGKCPICGMDLIPVPLDDGGDEDEDENRGEAPRLRLTPRSAALMQLEVFPAQRRQLEMPVRLFGRLDPDETRLRTISAWVPGRLDRLHVDFTGVSVRRGQPMVEIYSPKLIAAQEELLQAVRAARELAEGGIGVVRETTELTVEAARDRLRLLGLDDAQVAAVESRGRAEDHVIIPAPVSGVVIERLATVGDYVDTGKPIYRLADLSRLWTQMEVYESDLKWLAVGQPAVFRTESFPGEEFSGTVSFIDPTIDARKRTARVRVEVANPDGRLKPGMFVRGTVASGAGEDAGEHAGHADHGGDGTHPNAAASGTTADGTAAPLVIPATAPLITGRRAVVYVQLPDRAQPTFEPRDVLLGPRAGDWYVVHEGLADGELVVARGAFKIDSELQIRGRPSMMQPEGGPPPTHDHGGGQAEQGAGGGQAADAEAAARPPGGPAPRAFRAALGRTVKAQLALVEALAADNPAAARRAAALVDGALHELHSAGPAGRGAAQARADALLSAMHEALAGLSAADGLDGQRRHFDAFSAALIEAIDAFGVEDAGEVHRAMCPMVGNGRGEWLQAGRDLTNPYFGAAMLKCGEILDTLGAPAGHEGHGA